MYIDDVEAQYIQHRISESIGMARAAGSDCARMAHEQLVDRYRLKLTSLMRASRLGSPIVIETTQPPLAVTFA